MPIQTVHLVLIHKDCWSQTHMLTHYQKGSVLAFPMVNTTTAHQLIPMLLRGFAQQYNLPESLLHYLKMAIPSPLQPQTSPCGACLWTEQLHPTHTWRTCLLLVNITNIIWRSLPKNGHLTLQMTSDFTVPGWRQWTQVLKHNTWTPAFLSMTCAGIK